jgi:hypothetical protein
MADAAMLAEAGTLRKVATLRLHTQDTFRVVGDSKGNRAVVQIAQTEAEAGHHWAGLNTLDTRIAGWEG